MTGKDVAYFNALNNGLRLSFAGRLYSMIHCLNRRKKGKLDGPCHTIDLEIENFKSYLIMVGNTHRNQFSSTGGIRILFPGLSIHSESHIPPRTFANDVPISANITSEKYIGPFGGGKMHRRMALYV